MHVEKDASDCRVGNTFEASFHMFDLRGGMSAWHVCVWFAPSRMGGVRASGCWDTRAAEHTWLLTEFSNRLGAVDLNALVALGGQGAHFLHFPHRQLCRLRFHCIKANTQSNWYEGFQEYGALSDLNLPVIYRTSRVNRAVDVCSWVLLSSFCSAKIIFSFAETLKSNVQEMWLYDHSLRCQVTTLKVEFFQMFFQKVLYLKVYTLSWCNVLYSFLLYL